MTYFYSSTITKSVPKLLQTNHLPHTAAIAAFAGVGLLCSLMCSPAASGESQAVPPDGRGRGYIAFQSERQGPKEVLCVMNADRTVQIPSTNSTGRDVCPAFAPDSKVIAFSSDRTGDYEFYLISQDGTDGRRLTNSTGYDLHPSSPLSSDSIGCTGINCRKGSIILFGNNEDHGDPNSFIWFNKPRGDKFGGVYFGFQDKYPQGGMNEKGLSFDHFARPYLEVTGFSHLPQPPLSPRNGEWVYQMQETCETVAEAISYLRQFNIWFFNTFQLFLADRLGNSAIVEGDSIIYKNGDFQVVTNFLHSHPGLGNYPCWRYDTAVRMLKSCDSLTVDYLKSILDRTHTTSTCYTNIHNPVNGIIYLYYMHQFQNMVVLNVAEEIAKGDRMLTIPSLFDSTGVDDQSHDYLKSEMALHVYPNPFSASTMIGYHLSQPERTLLQIFDIMGHLVHTLVDHQQEAGDYQISWDGTNVKGVKVSTGVYLCRIATNTHALTSKLLLVK